MFNNAPYLGTQTAVEISIYSIGASEGGPFPPPGMDSWIDNFGNHIIDNLGNFIVFNPSGLFDDFWITNTGTNVIDNLGNLFIFDVG